jgi:hypothetical protein
MGFPEDIARLERDLRELIVRYEQYFFGIEKREPLQLLEEVERCARRYQNANITNTMQKFKYNSLVSTLSVHRQKWTRINRLIEEGKYSRDRFKMSLRQGEGGERAAAQAVGTPGTPLERIYLDYCDALKACNLPFVNLSREKIASAIERQKPAILEKYHCSDVQFVVVIEGGKPRLKARPKNR